MIAKAILFAGKPCILACDAQCHKAWGINQRPQKQLSDDPDDFYWLPDWALDNAPTDPGTYEGEDGKPQSRTERLNKWCARECERSIKAEPGEDFVLPDFAHAYYNTAPHTRPAPDDDAAGGQHVER